MDVMEPRTRGRSVRLRAVLRTSLDIVRQSTTRRSRELYRVTRDGGTALIQAPWRSVKGMPDELRERLRAQPASEVTAVQLLEEQTDEAARKQFGLDQDDPLFVCLRAA